MSTCFIRGIDQGRILEKYYAVWRASLVMMDDIKDKKETIYKKAESRSIATELMQITMYLEAR